MNTNINNDNNINNRMDILNEKTKANMKKRLKPHDHPYTQHHSRYDSSQKKLPKLKEYQCIRA